MLYALDTKNNKILATPKALAYCPQCLQQLIPKCGQIKVWHWAHKTNDCDSWHEPESEWHLSWKRLVDPQYTEVVMSCHRADIVGNEGVVIELQNSSISLDEIAERETFYGNMLWVCNAQPFVNRLRVNRNYSHELLDVVIEGNVERKITEFHKKLLDPNRKKGETLISPNSSNEVMRDLQYTKESHPIEVYDIQTSVGALPCPAFYFNRIQWNHLRKSHLGVNKPLFYDLGNDLMLFVKQFYNWGQLSGWVIEKEWFKVAFLPTAT